MVPARFQSVRFPGKPLALIGGIPLVVRALAIGRATTTGADVVVATDDDRIAEVVRAAGGEAIMTSPLAPSGSDRVWEVASVIKADVVVNLQGDEPMLPPSVVDALIERLAGDPSLDIATPVVRVPRVMAQSPDVVTVAADHGVARYFSRSVVPWGADPVLRHIGVYAYRWDALRRYVSVAPTSLEREESLEQLRALAIDLRIGVVEVDVVTHAVDRPEDVATVERMLGLAPAVTSGPVRLVVLDVDGVLTDGRISYLGGDAQLLSFDAKDGHGVVSLIRAGFTVAVMSARDSPALRHRVAELGIAEVHLSVTDKRAALVRLAERLGVPLAEVCFVGDDVVDLEAMAVCGLSAAPADATADARARATLVLSRPGGRGAVRELADLLLGSDLPATSR